MRFEHRTSVSILKFSTLRFGRNRDASVLILKSVTHVPLGVTSFGSGHSPLFSAACPSSAAERGLQGQDTRAGTLLFDLDGTLVHSVPDLCAALNRLMAARHMAAFSEAETAALVGDGVERLVQRAFAARGTSVGDAAVATFVADYTTHCTEQTALYPGAREALDLLHADGWRLALCTNKPEASARRLLQALGVGDRFSAIGAGDSFPYRKPDPRHILSTIAAAGGAAETAVMVGDHRNDVAGAHAAGLPAIFAAWGYGPPEMGHDADAVADSIAQVPDLARGLLIPSR